MVRSPECTILQQTMATAAGLSQIEQLIPSQYLSLKTVFLTMRKITSALNGGHDVLYQNNRSPFALVDYCFRLGSEQIPLTQNRCTGCGFVEAYEALKTALHCGGATLQSMGRQVSIMVGMVVVL